MRIPQQILTGIFALALFAGLSMNAQMPVESAEREESVEDSAEAVFVEGDEPLESVPMPEPPAEVEIPEELRQELDASSEAHFREELGVNEYTTPSIEKIFLKLGKLGPIPVDAIGRRLDGGNYTNRMQIAMNFGRFIAEGFLTVQTEDREEIEEVGRQLIRCARALGVGDSVTRHSKGLIESGEKGDWANLRRQLGAAQGDVEQAMLELRDEQLAHMIALGGWLRGLEIAAETLSRKHTEGSYGVLREIDLIDYFNERLDTLHPALKQTELIVEIRTNLKTIQAILEGEGGIEGAESSLYPSDIQEILERTRKLNALLSRPVEDWPETMY